MLRLATVFSGIGSIEQALKKLIIPYEIVFASDNGERYLNITVEEINHLIQGKSSQEKQAIIKNLYKMTNKTNYSKETYFANYKITEDRWFEDVRFIDGNEFKNQVDLFVGGSPCQSFSIIGKRGGLDDTRGTLFYDFARLVDEIQPKVFIYENVYGLKSHNKGDTWKVINQVFDDLRYHTQTFILNSLDYGIPQDRKRIFIVGFKQEVMINEPLKKSLNQKVKDFYEDEPVTKEHYLGKKGFEFVTNYKYRNRARVNKDIIQTQKANQQYNWNGDFKFIDFELIKPFLEKIPNAYIGIFEGKKGVIRKLTHKESLALMGYPKDFKLVSNNIFGYRLSGNSIVVNVLEHLLLEITKVIDFNEKTTSSIGI
jgi:DNA (cytosine-5)-methyltransferase 1